MYGSPEDLIGTVLGDTYELERVVGEGAYGTVYAAIHVRLHKPVAVKVLRLAEADAFARFRREAEITSSLGSRFIAQVFDFNTMPSGAPYLVMELLAGEDLGARLRARQRLPLAAVLKICEQASMALSVAHRHQIVHRDLKPQNIFLCKTEDEGEVVKVIDFGISKVLSQTGTTAAGQFIGTPLYMSPEQVRGQQQEIDERSDVYALAAVLYEAMAGRPAYEGDNIFKLVEKINGPTLPPPLSALDPAIPEAVNAVMLRAMAKRSADRPKSITAFYNELANAIRPSLEDEAATPAAAIMGTHALETMYATGMVATPLWRGRTGRDDELRFVAPDDGFFGGDNRNRVLKLTADKSDFFIGSVSQIESIHNDLVLPHRKVSRNAVRVLVRDGRAYLRREPRCSVPVRVGLSILEKGEERPLHHGQAVAIGVVAGVFHDGRFVPTQVPAQAVNEQTGLLGREGLAWEVALAARLGDGRRLLLAMPAGDDAGNQSIASRAALAMHAFDPSLPVARFRSFAAALIKPEVNAAALAGAAHAGADAPLVVGHHTVGESSDEAGARIDEAIGALERIAAGGGAPGVVNLSQHQLALYDLPRFQRDARAVVEAGGEIGLVALEEPGQLRQLGPAVFGALELELLQIAGRAAGSQAFFCRPAAGAVAFGGPDAAEPIVKTESPASGTRAVRCAARSSRSSAASPPTWSTSTSWPSWPITRRTCQPARGWAPASRACRCRSRWPPAPRSTRRRRWRRRSSWSPSPSRPGASWPSPSAPWRWPPAALPRKSVIRPASPSRGARAPSPPPPRCTRRPAGSAIWSRRCSTPASRAGCWRSPTPPPGPCTASCAARPAPACWAKSCPTWPTPSAIY